MSKKILIIGGCGYAGSALFEYFRENTSHDIYTVDIEWFGNFLSNKNHNKIYYYYLTKNFLSQFDTVVLLAAHSSVKMTASNYWQAFNNNVVNFVDLLTKLSPDQKFIFASSASLYSGLSGEYFTEDRSEYVALNLYDGMKKEIEIHAQLSNLQYYALRMGTVSGVSLNLRVDTIFGSMIQSYKENGHIDIFNGHARRGILSTMDFCRGVHSIVENGSYEKRGIYNLASFNTSINNIGKKFSEKFNCPINYLSNTDTCYDFTLNVTKMGQEFGFSPESTIEGIIQDLDWGWETMYKGVRDKVPEGNKLE